MKFEFHKVCRWCDRDYYSMDLAEDQYCELRDSRMPTEVTDKVCKIILNTTCNECSDRISGLMGLDD